MLKKIAAKVSDIFIAEDENYKLSLARDYGDGPEKMFLFEVTHNFTGEKKYILAESFMGACSQVAKEYGDSKYFTAKMIPMMIRGWGTSQF